MESPGFGASLQLQDCIQELMRFTLVSEIYIGLSKDYCSALLQEDPSLSFPNPTGLSEGVPLYPLYKHLAASLYKAISSEALPRAENKHAVKQETYDLKEGAFILINKCLVLQVQDVRHYHSFREMLEAESLKEVEISYCSIVSKFTGNFTQKRKKGQMVFLLSVLRSWFLSLSSIWAPCSLSMLSALLVLTLEELSYAGVQRLLGFACTAGTVFEALPPPTSSLISSFLLPRNPNAKGCMLTDGARALSKHVNRSSDRYWGSFSEVILIKIGLPWMSSVT